MTILLWIISAAIATLRVVGLTHPAYQAVAHLWVATLFTIFGVRQYHKIYGGWHALAAGLTLTAVETIVAFKLLP